MKRGPVLNLVVIRNVKKIAIIVKSINQNPQDGTIEFVNTYLKDLIKKVDEDVSSPAVKRTA